MGAGEVLRPGLGGRVGGGDRWAGEGRAGAASAALGGRRVRSKACGVPDSVLLCARSLCPGRSHFTRARGPGCNLSRTLILHIPLLGGRGEGGGGGRGGRGPLLTTREAAEGKGARRRAVKTILPPKPLGCGRSWGWSQRTGPQLRVPLVPLGE